ncbi:MAG: glutamate--tRNA ligase [Devosiaceae bacterium]|nr:glutamate--tRNA ligase [Devosiaceae bacterium]
MTKNIITRFAPSPTGFLHIGGARTALFNWVFAKKHNGKMVLRIEDTDRARYTEEASEAIIDGLSWLGIQWDGESVSQFANRQRHAKIAYELLQSGNAYKCYCTSEELSQMRELAKQKGLPPRYDGRWRDADPKSVPSDIPYVIRIKTPENKNIIINDLVQGEVRFNTQNLDDFILLRSDGTPTYMLAVVVDDHDMGATHVIRGDDHLTNTARQIVIYQALGWNIPQMAHLPLIHGQDGAKLSKRHGALGVDAYRRMGYLPQAMCNYLARLGWSHGDDEFFNIEQLVEWFDFDGLNKGAARFDFAKLENLNAQHIRQCASQELFDRMVSLADELGNKEDFDGLKKYQTNVLEMLEELKPRAKTLLDLISLAQFIYCEFPIKIEEKAAKQLNEQTRNMIAAIVETLEELDEWTAENISAVIRQFGEDNEIKLGKIAQPLRVALTGRTVSAGIFEMMAVIGKQETLKRFKGQARS